jgi:beta-xylosidase
MLFTFIISLLAVGSQAGPILARDWNSTLISPNASSLPAQLNQKNWHIQQAIAQDFPDPSIYREGNTWYAFSTASRGINTQVATSPDFHNWNVLQGHDALPVPPPWVDSNQPGAWAPDVFRNVSDVVLLCYDTTDIPQNKGQYIMYYSGAAASSPAHHCIGIARSNTIIGPYTCDANPIVCPLAQGGAIDAAHFQDNDGTRYMVYKVDGNSIGHGGSCNNGVAPIVSTPIMLQEMKPDGVTPVGNPIQILTNAASDGPLVEAPTLARVSGGRYMLLFSSGCYGSSEYDTKYALANKIKGPYTRGGAPLWGTNSDNLFAPGGADSGHAGTHVVFHAGQLGARYMYTAILSIKGGRVKAWN